MWITSHLNLHECLFQSHNFCYICRMQSIDFPLFWLTKKKVRFHHNVKNSKLICAIWFYNFFFFLRYIILKKGGWISFCLFVFMAAAMTFKAEIRKRLLHSAVCQRWRQKKNRKKLSCSEVPFKKGHCEKYNLETTEWIRVTRSWFLLRLCLCLFPTVLLCVSAADRDRAVGREALQLCPSQCGAVALVSLCGSRRAALGAGERLFSAMSQTALTECRLSGRVYLSLSQRRTMCWNSLRYFGRRARRNVESWILDSSGVLYW